MSHTIYISLGSNVERDKYTRAGLDGLASNFRSLQVSRVFESEAVGFAGSHFYNLVASAETDMSVTEVCHCLKQIENDNGRIRGEKKFAPRTLDLDLLLYDDLVIQEPVILPREEITYNAFVLLPMSELAPDLVHPLTKQNYATMWSEYDQTKQKLWPIDFNWSAPA